MKCKDDSNEREMKDSLPKVSPQRIDFLLSLPSFPKETETKYYKEMTTNYYEIHFSEFKFYNYHCQFTPNTMNTSLKRSLLISHFNQFGIHNIFTDGVVVSLPRKLNDEEMLFSIVATTSVTYYIQLTEIQSGNENKTNQNIQNELTKQQLQQDHSEFSIFDDSRRGRKDQGQFTLQKANILLKNIIIQQNNKIITYKKSFYDATKTLNYDTCDGPINILSGFSLTIKKFQERSFLIMNPSYKIFQTNSILEMIRNKSIEDINVLFNNFSMPISLFNKLTKRLVTIHSIDFSKNPLSTFELRSGEKQSFYEYYKNKYGYLINDFEQPLLVERKIDRRNREMNDNNRDYQNDQEHLNYYIPEMMFMTGLTTNMQNEKKLMMDLNGLFIKQPQAKIDMIKELMTNYLVNEQTQKALNDWNVTIDKTNLTVESFSLEKPLLIFQSKSLQLTHLHRFWEKEIINSYFYSPKSLTKWSVIISTTYSDEFERIENEIRKLFTKLHIEYESPRKIKLIGMSVDSIIDQINGDDQLVFVIVPNDNFYNEIKRKCISRNVVTQCILPATLKLDNINSLVNKLLLQIQAKIGGIPWTIKMSSKIQKTMFVGISIHNNRMERDLEIISLCCTIKGNDWSERKKYYVICKRENEIECNYIEYLLKKCIDEYYQQNDYEYPKSIVIYRRIHSENQKRGLFENEVKAISHCLYSMSQHIKLLYFTVKVRVDVKLFYSSYNSKENVSNYLNPTPGTIVKTGIFEGPNFEFYLMSHVPKKGLIQPVLYTCLYNSTTLSFDDITRFTYDLCYLYYSVAMSVYIPCVLFEAQHLGKTLNKIDYIHNFKFYDVFDSSSLVLKSKNSRNLRGSRDMKDSRERRSSRETIHLRDEKEDDRYDRRERSDRSERSERRQRRDSRDKDLNDRDYKERRSPREREIKREYYSVEKDRIDRMNKSNRNETFSKYNETKRKERIERTERHYGRDFSSEKDSSQLSQLSQISQHYDYSSIQSNHSERSERYEDTKRNETYNETKRNDKKDEFEKPYQRQYQFGNPDSTQSDTSRTTITSNQLSQNNQLLQYIEELNIPSFKPKERSSQVLSEENRRQYDERIKQHSKEKRNVYTREEINEIRRQHHSHHSHTSSHSHSRSHHSIDSSNTSTDSYFPVDVISQISQVSTDEFSYGSNSFHGNNNLNNNSNNTNKNDDDTFSLFGKHTY